MADDTSDSYMSDNSFSSTREDVHAATKNRKFAPHVTAILQGFHRNGLKGTGKKHKVVIERAAQETGLTSTQVKVQ